MLESFRARLNLPDGRLAAIAAVHTFGDYMQAFNRNFDVVVERRGQKQHLTVFQRIRIVAEHYLADGESAEIQLP
ncbi:MAG: hypothetical protein NTV46_04285 [Verrucomicrobia bacterium]|nr:hypothetical protein [Verrucomicrobiota bacterium]